MNALRKRKKTITFDKKPGIPADLDQGILTIIEKQDRYALYRTYFSKLGKACQDVLSYFLNGKSMVEIATLMGYTPAYTRKKKFECKRKLIEMIENDPIFQELSTLNDKSKHP